MLELYLPKDALEALQQLSAGGGNIMFDGAIPAAFSLLAKLELAETVPCSPAVIGNFDSIKTRASITEDGEQLLLRYGAAKKERRRDTRWRIISLAVSIASILIAAASLTVSIIVAAK